MPEPNRQSVSRRLADTWNQWVPIGLAPSVILILGLISGLLLLAQARGGAPRPDLVFWTFAVPHYNAALRTTPAFEEAEDVNVKPQHVHGSAVTRRLRAAYAAGIKLPDLVEVEITPVGSFFRGPTEEIPFIDLKPRLIESGLMDRIVQSRLSPYTVPDSQTGEELIVGLPHDVHPVAIAYRRDLFEELGIDPEQIETWDQFIEIGRRLTIPGQRYMIQLEDTSAVSYEVMLYQRGGNFFTPQGELRMDDEVAYQTLLWLVPLVAGDDRISTNPGSFGQAFYRGIEEGYFLCFICPDWRAGGTKFNLPDLDGKLGLMPMPAFEPGGRRTSTWGGTMIGITRTADDPDLAWRYALHMYLDPDTAADNFRETFILPPFKDLWDLPAFHEPSEYFGGQKVGRLYMALAEDVPPQYGSPYLQLAKNKMGEVVAACTAYYRANGEDGFDAFARQRLDEAAEYVRFQMQRNPF